MAGLAEPGFKSKAGVYLALRKETTSDQDTSDCQQVCKPPQELPLEDGFAFPDRQVGSRKGSGTILSGFLQLVISGSKTEQEMVTNLRKQGHSR